MCECVKGKCSQILLFMNNFMNEKFFRFFFRFNFPSCFSCLLFLLTIVYDRRYCCCCCCLYVTQLIISTSMCSFYSLLYGYSVNRKIKSFFSAFGMEFPHFLFFHNIIQNYQASSKFSVTKRKMVKKHCVCNWILIPQITGINKSSYISTTPKCLFLCVVWKGRRS